MNIRLIPGIFAVTMLAACTINLGGGEKHQFSGDMIGIVYETGPEINSSGLLSVWIINESENCFVFPSDFGARIFMTTTSTPTPTQLNNLAQYLPDEEIILEAQGDLFSTQVVTVKPDLTGIIYDEDSEFYVLIAGTYCDESTTGFEKKIPFSVIP